MHPRRTLGVRRFLLARSPLLLSLSLVLGCGTVPLPGTDNTSRPRPDDGSGDGPEVQDRVIEAEQENSMFDAAQPAPLPPGAEITIEGTVDSIDDVDIYALGPVDAGERIIVDVTGQDGLNTAAALFDGNQDLIDANDDRSYYAGVLDPYLAQVMRASTGNLYLGVGVSRASHFASDAGRYASGTYTVRVRRESGAGIPSVQSQVVFLDFEGGDTVQIGLEPFEVMRPFSGEVISSRLAGQTDSIVTQVVDHMLADYAQFDVTLLNSRHHAAPGGAHSTLYFGNYNAAYLGLADNVDTGNVYLQQEAIIYAEDLALFESLTPSAEEIALALANIASHELGHLLGLEHTSEAGDLMATAATARQVIEIDAGFARSRLLEGVFPVGWQNGPGILLLTVGSNPSGSANARWSIMDTLPPVPIGFRDDLEDIPLVMCGRCSNPADDD